MHLSKVDGVRGGDARSQDSGRCGSSHYEDIVLLMALICDVCS
jgi:hypothetical protein